MRSLVLLIGITLTAVVQQGPALSLDDRVRPGLGFSTDSGSCTFGFLLQGSDRRTYAATAGHCALAEDGERVWEADQGPRVLNDRGRAIGHFVYATESTPDRTDFALIRLAKGIQGNPQMCAWGGPTKLFAGAQADPVELYHHGQGVAISSVAPTRRAFATSLPAENYTVAAGAALPGDSGSAVRTADGAALGSLVELTVDGGTARAGIGVVRLEHALRAASARTGTRFKLLTAPLLPAPAPTDRC